MVTNADAPQAEPTRSERADEAMRTVVAGHPQGAIRRIVLYTVTFGLVVSPVPVLAVIPLTLLALTDQLA